MSPDARASISDAEREVLLALWGDGPGSVREVHLRLGAAGLAKLRQAIRSAAPQAEECISFQLPGFRRSGATKQRNNAISPDRVRAMQAVLKQSQDLGALKPSKYGIQPPLGGP